MKKLNFKKWLKKQMKLGNISIDNKEFWAEVRNQGYFTVNFEESSEDFWLLGAMDWTTTGKYRNEDIVNAHIAWMKEVEKARADSRKIVFGFKGDA